MLKSIDVLIGLAVIMLALSMAVTVITQFVTTVLNSRGLYLKRGLVDLLAQIDPKLTEQIAGKVAEWVLKHPLVNATFGRLGSVVHREEFTRLLLDAAGGDDKKLDADAFEALKQALKNNGIDQPDVVLKNIRAASLQLESSSPELAASVRSSLAILQEAKSDLVAKVNGWFDQTMDRVAQRFTAHTRAIAFIAAVLVAVVLQVDTVLLVNRLSADDKLRDAFLAKARSMQQPAASQPTATPPAAPASDGAEIDREYLAFLADHGLITVPHSFDDWTRRWNEISSFGVVVTALLLSLGAPFWYNALRRLLQLRSVLAEKDDQQRAARQGIAPAGDGGQAATPAR
jgi:hypothetical protein